MADGLTPELASRDNDTKIKRTKATVGGSQPFPWPANSSFPLTSSPDQEDSHGTTHQRQLLGSFNDPVDGTTSTSAIFSFLDKEGIEEPDIPDGEDQEKERVEAATRDKVKILSSEGGFEDEEVQVDLGRRGWKDSKVGVRRVFFGLRGLAEGLERGRGRRSEVDRWNTFDDLIQASLTGHAVQTQAGECTRR